MNFARLVCCLALFAWCASAFAQDKQRKTMTFFPGAPPASTAPAPAPAPAPAAPASPVDLSGPEAPAQIAGNFFALLQRGEVEKSYAELTRGSKIAERPEDLKT